MVYLIRHTTPAIEAGVCYGRSDLALADTAPREIAAVLEAIPDITIVYSSPAQRCLRLAQAVTAAQGIDHQTDPRLQEIDFGDWEGRRWDDIPVADIARWDAQLWDHTPGGGESLRDLWQRVAEFSDDGGRLDPVHFHRRGSVGVDVPKAPRLDAGLAERRSDCQS